MENYLRLILDFLLFLFLLDFFFPLDLLVLTDIPLDLLPPIIEPQSPVISAAAAAATAALLSSVAVVLFGRPARRSSNLIPSRCFACNCLCSRTSSTLILLRSLRLMYNFKRRLSYLPSCFLMGSVPGFTYRSFSKDTNDMAAPRESVLLVSSFNIFPRCPLGTVHSMKDPAMPAPPIVTFSGVLSALVPPIAVTESDLSAGSTYTCASCIFCRFSATRVPSRA